MSDHLLECPSSNTCECNMGPVHKDSCPQRKKCICTELRACEQRVRQDMALQYLVTDREHQEAEQRAYAAGVQAARDAVAGLPWDNSGAIDPVDALAAIDALRSHHDT